MRHRVSPVRRAGFTLVELLVVIGIIALLISILLPTLGKARRLANATACASTMRQISMAMLQYTNAYKGSIPGNAWTSGSFLKAPGTSFSDNNCPGVSQTWDWEAPCAKYMGIKFDEGGGKTSRSARFDSLCRRREFQCVENDIVMGPYGSSPVTITTQMIPYVTVAAFQYVYNVNGGDVALYQNVIDTGNYAPKINKVGISSEKIWMAEGARWTNSDGPAPDYNLGWDNSGTSPGGHYAEWGPWSGYSRSYLKGRPMIFSMRHGDRGLATTANIAGFGRMRFNVAYFDGHVSAIDGRAAQNPIPWLPRGTKCPITELSAEAKQASGFTSDIAVN